MAPLKSRTLRLFLGANFSSGFCRFGLGSFEGLLVSIHPEGCFQTIDALSKSFRQAAFLASGVKPNMNVLRFDGQLGGEVFDGNASIPGLFQTGQNQILESTPLSALGRTARFSAIACFMAFCRDSCRGIPAKGGGNFRLNLLDFCQELFPFFGKRQEGTEGRRGQIQAHAERCYSFGGGLTSQNPSRQGRVNLTARRDKEILSEMRMASKKAAEVDTVTVGQKAAAKARRAVSAMSRETQQELARQGMAKLYQAAGHGEAKAVRC